MLFTIGIIVIVIIIIAATGSAEKQEIKEITKKSPNSIKYNAENGELILNERSEDFKKLFSTERYISTRHGYAEEKLIFTSATVGGITTGGWDKVGGYGTEKKKTNKYNLVYEYVNPEDNSYKRGYVNRIILSDELLKKAQTSNVKPYLDGNSIIVVNPLIISEKELNGYVNLHRIRGGGYTTHIANLKEDDKIRTLPDVIKVNYILNWICENDSTTNFSTITSSKDASISVPTEKNNDNVDDMVFEKELYDIELSDIRKVKKIPIIKAIREYINDDIESAKEMVDTVPCIIEEQVPASYAFEIKEAFEKLGAKITLK